MEKGTCMPVCTSPPLHEDNDEELGILPAWCASNNGDDVLDMPPPAWCTSTDGDDVLDRTPAAMLFEGTDTLMAESELHAFIPVTCSTALAVLAAAFSPLAWPPPYMASSLLVEVSDVVRVAVEGMYVCSCGCVVVLGSLYSSELGVNALCMCVCVLLLFCTL
jgi:hypothetical protein